MEFKRRSEIDRLLSDEGTRNLLSGIKVIHKSKKMNRIVTRNLIPKVPNKNATKGIIANTTSTSSSSSSSRVKVSNSNEKTKKIIKKSLSLLGHSNKINSKINNGPGGSGGGIISNGGAKLSNGNGVRGSGAGFTNLTSTLTNTKGLSASGSGSGHNINNINDGVFVANAGPKTSGSSSGHNSSPALPLLATIVRGHVGFITLSYQNHLCVLRTQDLRDLVRKLEEYESRKGISVIVMNSSSDRFFCDGLDYKELIHSDLNKRKLAVQHRINCIKNVLNTLAKSKKLLIASVNGGKVNGIGMMFLGLFDLVYSNDKATFSLHSAYQLRQPPEGISVFSQAQLQTPMMKSLVYMGRVCTASEMHQNGFLITDVLWDGSRYHEQLASKLQQLSNINTNTKSIYKTYSSKNLKQLGVDLVHEFSILESTWTSEQWQKIVVQQLRDRHN